MPALQPQKCPHHPDITTYYTATHETAQLTLTQHRCAKDGCDQPLGWIFNSRHRQHRTQSGPGLCQDPEIFLAMQQDAHDNAWAMAQAVPSMTTIIATIVAFFLVLAGNPFVYVPFIATAVPVLAAAIAYCRHQRYRRNVTTIDPGRVPTLSARRNPTITPRPTAL